MTMTLLKYQLANGYLHHWLVAGPQILPAEVARFPSDQRNVELNILQHFFQPDAGVGESTVDLGALGPATKDDPLLVWRYYRCEEDHYVDFSTVHPTCCYARAWAYAQLDIQAARSVTFILTTHGPADIWLNGSHLCRQGHFEKRSPRSVRVEAVLQPGKNEILVRFESAGVRETPHVMALQIQGLADTDATVTLPTNIEPELLEKRETLEKVVDSATLDRYVYGFMGGDRYNRNESITVRFPASLNVSAEITARVQSLAGDIFQEATTRCGADTTLELAKAFPLRSGPHHLALLPPADEYYQKNLRFERKELLYVIRMPYSQRANVSPESRATEALEDAAQRRNGSLHAEIAKMALGRWDKINDKVLQRAIENVYQSRADSGVDLLGLLSIAFRFRESLPQFEALRSSIEADIISYRYWREGAEAGCEPLDFSRESWQIMYHTCEILAGQLLPEQTFQSTGKTGAWHRERGEALAGAWIRRHGRYGFKEWDSPAGIEVILGALAHLVDLASSEIVSDLASVLMDKILFSLAVNTFKGAYGSSKGWADTASVLSARLEATSGIARLMWGQGNYNDSVMGMVSLACCQKYDVPDVIREIAADPVGAWWSQERNRLPVEEAAGEEAAHLWEVSKVTYKTNDFMLSCAPDYRPGQPGHREHIWQATLGPDAIVFANHPTRMSVDDAHFPNLWVGSGALPRAAQWGDVLIALYSLPVDDWLGFTHAYFPTTAFDEHRINGQWAFARKGNGYLALRATRNLEFVTKGPTAFRELRSRGREHIWLCHMGQALLDGSFEEFQRKVTALNVTTEGLSIRLTSLRGDHLAFGWEGALMVNGQEQPLAGERHIENPYCTAELPASEIDIVHGEEGLRLSFE